MGVMEAATTATATEAPAEAGVGSHSEDKGATPETADRHGGPNIKTQPAETDDERDEQGRYLSREAASYRRRLRDAEAERDDLRGRLEGYERAEVERLAGDAGLQVPGDVWTFGASLDTLRGEDGGIDSESVHELATSILKDRPGLAQRPAGDLGIGRGAAAAGTTHAPEVGLSALLKPERR
jgi:hypothetical protein